MQDIKKQIRCVISTSRTHATVYFTDGTSEERYRTPWGQVSLGSTITRTTLDTSERSDKVRTETPATHADALHDFTSGDLYEAVKYAIEKPTGFCSGQFEAPALYEAVKRKASRDKKACLELLDTASRYRMLDDKEAVLEAAKKARLYWVMQGDEESGPVLDVEVPQAVLAGRELRVQLKNFLKALEKEFWKRRLPSNVAAALANI